MKNRKWCDTMLTLDIITTFAKELMEFIDDTKTFIVDLFSNIHHFLNKFMGDEAIIMFGILIAAMIAIFIFRLVINKR